MRRIVMWSGTLVLGLATLMWAAAPASAQRGGERGRAAVHEARVEHGVPPHGNFHPVARGGSIHFAERAGRDPVGPPFGPDRRVDNRYRNPYRDDYFRRFRPGYRPLVLGGAQYYMYPNLPSNCQTVLANGITYDVCDGVYYQPYMYQGQTVYLVVPPV